MSRLVQIDRDIDHRVAAIVESWPDWPCRKGCADCCRSLAAEPTITAAEWHRLNAALDQLPPEVATAARHRIRSGHAAARPVTCPLLDTASGACLIYDARPIACREYGFYAERDKVLGCARIHAIAEAEATVIWGNHTAVEAQQAELGLARPLSHWSSRNLVPESA